MRRVVWARSALDDLAATARYIAQEDRRAAERVAQAIRAAGRKLGERPTGRPGRVPDTFEKSLAPLPYIIAYTISRRGGDEMVVILRVIHTARDWQPGRWPV